jgi:PAS domain-containing protein
MSVARRVLLLAASLLPTLMVLAAVLLLGSGEDLYWAAGIAAVISLAVTWVATTGPRRHQHALDVIGQALEADSEDEEHLVAPWMGANPPRGTMSALTIELCKRLVLRRKQLRQTMMDTINALASLTNPNLDAEPAALPAPETPDPDDGRTLSSTYHIHSRNYQQLRLRDAAMTALLRDLPLAVLATDLELRVQYANPQAETLFGMNASRLQRVCLTKLFTEPPKSLLSQDVTLPHGIGPKVFYQRLLENKLKELTVWIRNAQGKLIPAMVAVRLGQHHVFQFLPLADPLVEHKSQVDQNKSGERIQSIA